MGLEVPGMLPLLMRCFALLGRQAFITFHCRCLLVSHKCGVVVFAQHPCTRSAGKYVVSRQAQASQQLQTSPQRCLVSHASMPGELVHQAVVIMHVSANAGFACFTI